MQLSDGRALIRRSLCELLAHHEDVQLELGDFGAMSLDGLPTERPRAEHPSGARSPRQAENRTDQTPPACDSPTARRLCSHADASVGTDDDDTHNTTRRLAARQMSAQQVIEVLDRGIPSGMLVELRANHRTRTFDVQRDVASLVCRRSAAALAIRLRWPCIVICALGATVPILVLFALHWAHPGGLGQFAPAYAWPLWLEIWVCVGYWLSAGVLLLWYASLQCEIALLALRQFSTMWIMAMTGVFVAAWVSLWEFGVHKSTWVLLPVYIDFALFFPLMALADALPIKLRLHFVRFFGPFVLICAAAVAVVLRLPTAEDTPGQILWTVMGTDAVTNLEALTSSATVMTALLAEGVLRAWVLPHQLAFVVTSFCVGDFAPDRCAAVPPGSPRALAAKAVAPAWPSASVAPQPLEIRVRAR